MVWSFKSFIKDKSQTLVSLSLHSRSIRSNAGSILLHKALKPDSHVTRSSIFKLPLKSNMPIVWYCCQCGDGPNNPSTTTHCTGSCTSPHQKCPSCTEATTDQVDNEGHSDNEDTQSETSDCACGMSPPLRLTIQYPYAILSEKTEAPTLALSTCNSLGFAPLTHGNLAWVDQTTSDQSGVQCYGGIRERPEGKPTYYWSCCQCGGGPQNVEYHPGCGYCSNHWRCGGCTVTQDKK